MSVGPLIQKLHQVHSHSSGGHPLGHAAGTDPHRWTTRHGEDRCGGADHFQSLPQLPRPENTPSDAFQPGGCVVGVLGVCVVCVLGVCVVCVLGVGVVCVLGVGVELMSVVMCGHS